MISTKKIIPSLAIAGLSLSGCGNDNAIEDVVDKLCAKYEACDVELEDECEPYFTNLLDEFGEAYGEACQNAYIQYLDCTAELSCDALDDEEDDCVELYSDVQDLCDDD